MAIIAHLDLDAFFAAVEERDQPHLRGRPVVVGADPKGGAGRGIVSTANYAAREYGIRSAMPIREAWRRSEWALTRGKPRAAFLTPRFGAYSEASDAVFAIVSEYAGAIEKTSVDEAYLDLSNCPSYEAARRTAEKLKRRIRKNTKLTASIGIAPNKLVAKIASDAEKPDGLTVVEPDAVPAFLAPLPIRALPGIGPKSEEKLNARKIFAVADLQRIPEDALVDLFGSWGASIYRKARGVGSTELISESEPALSIGRHVTFPRDIHSLKVAGETLAGVAADIATRAARQGFFGFRTVVVTVRFADFETQTRSLTARVPLTSARELELRALKLVLPFFEKRGNPQGKAIRMLGLRVEQLI